MTSSRLESAPAVSASLLLLLLVATSLVCAENPENSCVATGAVVVGDNINPIFPAEPAPVITDGVYTLYGKQQVRDHFVNQPPPTFRNGSRTTFSCVDARGDEPTLGTPGGDLGEIIAATMAYFKLNSRPFSVDEVTNFFSSFMAAVARPNRPIYYHTDDSRLRLAFQIVADAGVSPQPSILPLIAPLEPALRATWLDALTLPETQGCGHIRLLLGADAAAAYSVLRSGPNVTDCVPGDCIESNLVGTQVIREWYKFWWPTPVSSEQRDKITLVVDLGPLIGKAVTVVSTSNNTGACTGLDPLVVPNVGASQVFVYHANAVQRFRRFASRQLGDVVPQRDRARFERLWNEIAGRQLGATLTLLAPAKDVGIFPVSIGAEG